MGPSRYGEAAGIARVQIDGAAVAYRVFFQEGGREEPQPKPSVQACLLIGSAVHQIAEDSRAAAEAAPFPSIGGNIQEFSLPGDRALQPFIPVDQIRRQEGNPNQQEAETGGKLRRDVDPRQQPHQPTAEQQQNTAEETDLRRVGPPGQPQNDAKQSAYHQDNAKIRDAYIKMPPHGKTSLFDSVVVFTAPPQGRLLCHLSRRRPVIPAHRQGPAPHPCSAAHCP